MKLARHYRHQKRHIYEHLYLALGRATSEPIYIQFLKKLFITSEPRMRV